MPEVKYAGREENRQLSGEYINYEYTMIYQMILQYDIG